MLEKLNIPTQQDIAYYDEMLSEKYHPNWCKVIGCPKCQNAYGLPVSVNPHCGTCGGFGRIYPRDKFNKIDYKTLIDCPDCKDATKSITGKTVLTFNSFITSRQGVKNPHLTNAKDKMQLFATNQGKPFVLMYGGSGVGKSLLCKIAREQLESKNEKVLYFSCSELLDWLKQGIEDKSYPEQERTNFLKEVFVLIIDDFKVEYTKEWSFERLEYILDFRYETFKPTLLTTNNNITDLPFRLQDRFKDKEISEIIKIDVPSFRGLKK